MNKNYPYTTPGNYTFDSSKIEIVGGIAKLKAASDYSELSAYYKFEDDVIDNSGQGNNGINNGATFVDGHVDRCLSFNGASNYVDFSSLVLTDQNKFSIAVWFNVTDTAPYQTIFAQYDISAGAMPFPAIEITAGTIRFRISTQAGGYTEVSTAITTGWHLVIVTLDGNAMNLYLDNGSAINATFAGAKRTVATTNIGARTYTSTDSFFGGLIDEVAIYENKILSSDERTSFYNAGVGRHLNQYLIDKPTIEPTLLFDPAVVSSWDSFSELLGGGNQGVVGYNLYKVDKANKYYWNGSVWVSGGDENNYNSLATVNANIPAFDASPDKIGYIAYLISNGEQQIELDENSIGYSENQPPLINAGTNKFVKDNLSISPFSDCSFSDPDGTIDHVYYKVDGEVDVWTEILQGGYGTLLEAVQAFNYQFTNSGTKIVSLQVEDNVATTSEDNLEVDVQKYQVTFNVKNSLGIHLPNVNFNPGDGSGWQIVNSPFTYGYDYNVSDYTAVIDKPSYGTQTASVESTDHTENFTLIGLGTTPQDVYDYFTTSSREEIFKSTDKINRILGLSQSNYRLFNLVYDPTGNLVSSTIKIYLTASDCTADTNVLQEYALTAIYNVNGRITDYKVVEV